MKISPQKVLRDLKAEHGTWEAVSDWIGKPDNRFNRGYLQQVATGKREASNRLLIAIGLPPKQVLAPACPHCGQVHITRRCISKEPRANRPRRNWQRACMAAWGLLWGHRNSDAEEISTPSLSEL